MRKHYAFVLVVALVAPSTVGQEEPLPAVVPLRTAPAVALAVEPMLEPPPAPTLESAARANDYATFSALFDETKNPAYAPLHDLWTYSVTDPIGAFYGPERYEQLARMYPGFAAFIDEHRIVDDHGNVFYPTSETRAFLLARAVEGVIAERRTGVSPSAEPAPVKAEVAVGLKPAVPPAPAPAPEPVVIAEAAPPIVVRAEPTPAPAPAPAPVVVAPAPVVKAPAPPPAPAPTPQANQTAGRGLLLVIVGLIGVGLLALILRTPNEGMATPRRDP